MELTFNHWFRLFNVWGDQLQTVLCYMHVSNNEFDIFVLAVLPAIDGVAINLKRNYLEKNDSF